MTNTTQPRSIAGEALLRIGLTYRELQDLLGVHIGTVNAKMNGRSRFTKTQRDTLYKKYGEDGQALVDAVEAMFRAYVSGTQEERRKLSAAGRAEAAASNTRDGANIWPLADGSVLITEDGDPELLTIDEWKARYGEPGLASDRHGRMMGYFTTEPDYCED